MIFELAPIVLDCGSYQSRAGLALINNNNNHSDPLQPSPKVFTRTMLGRYPQAQYHTIFLGDEVLDRRGFIKHCFPIQRGQVTDWHDLETFWDFLIFNHVLLNHGTTREHSYSLNNHDKVMGFQETCTDRALLLNENPFMGNCCFLKSTSTNHHFTNNLNMHREKTIQIMFEKLQIPALCLAPSPLMSLYANGKTNGVVVECGHGVTQIASCLDGKVVANSVKQLEVAGSDLTQTLAQNFRQKGLFFKTFYEIHCLCKEIKETLCYVALDYESEMKKDSSLISKEYELPDGTLLNTEYERFKTCEILFQPELYQSEELSEGTPFEIDDSSGIHQLALDSIRSCSDMHARLGLYSNIVLAGESTLLPGFKERLLKEMIQLAPSQAHVQVEPKRHSHSCTPAWIGGSILASMSIFPDLCMNKQEYHEEGAIPYSKRCLHKMYS